MSITKRIRTHKTPMGYSITIWTKDPGYHAGVLRIIDLFFEKCEKQDEKKQTTLYDKNGIVHGVCNDNAMSLQNSKEGDLDHD